MGLAFALSDVEAAVDLGHQDVDYHEGHRRDAQGAAGAQEKEIFQAEQAEKAGGAQQKGQQLH